MNSNQWANYWNKQSDPRHSTNNDDFFKEIAKEIEYHLGDLKNKNILELGCGDGSILKFLPITHNQYTGVDFSQSLLDILKSTLPNFTVHKMGATEFLKKNLQEDNKKYDIIFSYGVLQYFEEQQLKELFLLQKNNLNPEGTAFHFGIPVVENKRLFTSGKGIQNKNMFQPRQLIKQIKSKYSNNIGHWHKLDSYVNYL